MRLQLYWIPIRDWNPEAYSMWLNNQGLQLYWIPIRDWNAIQGFGCPVQLASCNYIESLLGIET